MGRPAASVSTATPRPLTGARDSHVKSLLDARLHQAERNKGLEKALMDAHVQAKRIHELDAQIKALQARLHKDEAVIKNEFVTRPIPTYPWAR